MNPDSRIWIYQANRLLTESETAQINELAKQFVASWNSHGTQLVANITLKNNLHLVVSVDESHKDASGCSIDSSVRFVKALEEQFNLDFFDRMMVAYYSDNQIHLAKAHDIAHIVTAETLVYNNLIDKYYQLNKEWLLPAKDTWVANFLA